MEQKNNSITRFEYMNLFRLNCNRLKYNDYIINGLQSHLLHYNIIMN